MVFSEPVTDFATGDVTLSGTAGATTATVTGSGTTYNVAVSGMTANGTVIASLLAGVAHDAANNPSLASTSTDNTVTFSSLPPDADFDSDGDIDGLDFLAWQRGYGIQAPNATKADGDADNDLDVDGADLGIWEGQYGTGGAVAAAASLSESIEATPRAIAEPVAVESPTVANALQPLSAELVDVAIAWDLASRPRQKVHPAPAALAEKVHSDRLPPAVSRAQSMPWHAGSNTAKHLVLRRRADDISDFEGDDAVDEQLLDRLFAEDELLELL